MKKFIALIFAVLFATSAFAQNAINNPPAITYPFILGGVLKAANFNSTADQAITIVSPSPNYRVNSIIMTNPSISLTTAAGGLYSATAKGGIPIVAATQTYIALTTNAPNTTGNTLLAGQSTTSTAAFYNLSTVYLSLTTPQGAAATADVYIYIVPLP